jgi:hypothetical protein
MWLRQRSLTRGSALECGSLSAGALVSARILRARGSRLAGSENLYPRCKSPDFAFGALTPEVVFNVLMTVLRRKRCQSARALQTPRTINRDCDEERRARHESWCDGTRPHTNGGAVKRRNGCNFTSAKPWPQAANRNTPKIEVQRKWNKRREG